MERAPLYIGIIDHITFIVPVCKGVGKRWPKSEERYTRDDAAIKKYAANALSGRWLFVANKVLI